MSNVEHLSEAGPERNDAMRSTHLGAVRAAVLVDALVAAVVKDGARSDLALWKTVRRTASVGLGSLDPDGEGGDGTHSWPSR